MGKNYLFHHFWVDDTLALSMTYVLIHICFKLIRYLDQFLIGQLVIKAFIRLLKDRVVQIIRIND
jgi:hypothetical protein